MTITPEHFTRTIQGVIALRPFSKALPESAILLAWGTFPIEAKRQLTNDHLTFAATQLMLDPEPDPRAPVHLALLRYLYKLENGWFNLSWGLKDDLSTRMAQPSTFHPLTASQPPLWASREPSALPVDRKIANLLPSIR